MIAELATLEPIAPETQVDGDGFIYRVDTGEVIGHAGANERFKIDSQDDADCVLEMRSKIEGDIAATEARIRGVLAQLEAIKAKHVRRLSWWEWRFGSDLIGFARSQLKGKSRTAQFGWGRVSFRATKGITSILDPDAAVAFVELYDPSRVATKKSVGLKDVLAVLPLALEAGDEDRPNWLKTSEPGENIVISTGIETEAGR